MSTATKENTITKEASKDGAMGYNEVPYVSYPFEFNRPENLRTVGKLFGHEAPAIEKARVLELGGSDGMNLLRFASDYPESYCLGIDLSKVEIEHGQQRIKDIGLKNYDLKCVSITDLDESYGKFDYIICHGVYSWVPDFVREGIFEVTKKLLNKNGLAFISYNVRPGWNMINSIRELMVYHASNFENVNDQISQSRLALDFISDTVKDLDTPYAKLVNQMAEDLKGKADNYLRHEYLADENQAFYFHKFIEDARKHDLEYMGDTDVQRMFTGNLPAEAAEKLNQINDIVRTEQYIDFIKNTQFRCTVLCHKDVKISRNIDNKIFHDFYYSGIFTADKEINEQNILSKTEKVSFKANNNEALSITTSSPELKAVFATIMENVGNPLKIEEMADMVAKKYKKIKKEDVIKEIDSVIGRILFSGYIKFYYTKPKSISTISKKPKVSDFNIYNIQKIAGNQKVWVTNQLNQMINVEDYYRHFVPLVNGENTVEDLNKKVQKLIDDKILLVQVDGKAVEDKKVIEDVSKQFVQGGLNVLSKNYMLIA